MVGIELQEKLTRLGNEAWTKAEAYREKLEKDLASNTATTQESNR